MMDTELVTQLIFGVVGGLGLFLLGMKHMSEGMQAIAGNRLRQMIHAGTNNRFFACLIGVFVTCVIQSSSVTTVMTVGFVNSGLMTLNQAIGVILGANVGTTITGWILVLNVGKWGLPLLGLAAFFFLFTKNEKVRFVAMAMMGIGMVFFGLETMSNGFKPLRMMPEFVEWFAFFQATGYLGVLKCAFAGCVLTLIVQSSSATLGITMGLASAGVINFETGAALVLGENIGTTITAFFSSIGASTSAKRAAYSHMLFNVIGVAVVTAVFPFYIDFVERFVGVNPGTAVIDANGESTYPYVRQGIALVHTGFNVALTLVFLPFLPWLARLVTLLVPDRGGAENLGLPRHLITRAVNDPDTALDLAEREQTDLLARLPGYLDLARSEVEPLDQIDLKTRSEAFNAVSREVHQFLSSIIDKDISHETTRRLLGILERQGLLDSLEKSVNKITSILYAENQTLEFQDIAGKFLEGTQTVLLSAVDAAEGSDDDIEILVQITSDKGGLMKKIRGEYLTLAENIDPKSQAELLDLTNLFERATWLLRKYGESLHKGHRSK